MIKAQLPKTDVYLAEFKLINTKPQLSSIKYLNGFNPNGYNNQAKFIDYNQVYLSVAKDTHKITDIYHLDLSTNEIDQFTNTENISEFSPTLSSDKDQLTTVRIESDGKDQSLWSYPLSRKNLGKRLLPSVTNIGYYTWVNADSVAMFLVGNPHQLAIANVKTNKVTILLEDIGRCIKISPEGNLLLVHKIRPDLWMLKSYNFSDGAFTNICQMPYNKEDFDVMVNGTILTADGSMLKTFNPTKDKLWVLMADFSSLGIYNLSRPSVVRDRVLFINNKS